MLYPCRQPLGLLAADRGQDGWPVPDIHPCGANGPGGGHPRRGSQAIDDRVGRRLPSSRRLICWLEVPTRLARTSRESPPFSRMLLIRFSVIMVDTVDAASRW